MVLNCGHIPIIVLEFTRSIISRSWSAILMLPSDRFKSIVMMLNMVDLPAPLGPSSPNTSPFLTQNVLPLTAATPFL